MEEKKTDKLRILVIDDNTAIHQDFRKILDPFVDPQKDLLSELDVKLFPNNLDRPSESSLDHLHYSLDFATQGQEAVKATKKALEEGKPYALAFVDIRMPPGWDGIETTREIWKIDPWIQIVICTAYSDYAWDQMIEKLGVSDNLLILKKPFDVIEVRQLASSLTEKWQLNIKLQKHVSDLETTVKERTTALEKSLALVRSTLESTADGILVDDLESNIVDYNATFSNMWQIPESALKANLTKDIHLLESDQLIDPEAFFSKLEYLNKNLENEAIDELNLKDGRSFERYYKPHRLLGKIIGRVWSFRNVSEQKKLHQELLFQATHDKLTNLPNRRLLYERMEQHFDFAKQNNTMAAVLLFDLDKFKLINDSLGHTAGDSALKLVAKRISEVIRDSDTLARLGGDEFVIVLDNIKEKAEAELVAKKVMSAIIQPFKLLNYEFFLSSSIGISLYPRDGNTSEELLQKADGAMYSIKNAGKNGFKFCQENLVPHILQQISLENDLRKSIQKKQLKLYYQPIIEIVSGDIVGVEALIRWQHPTLGLLLPEAFLQIAEESGFIVEMGEWVLKNACIQNKQWQMEKLPILKIAVNISSTQLKYHLFKENLEKIIKETELDPQYLELELTETTIIENPKLTLEIMDKIKKLGIELVIDDFGTGFSSLSYLRQFSFDKLKIDMAFVRDININKNASGLIQSIIEMGINLNLKVVAEGVETVEQISLLKRYKCDQAQGYLFSVPVEPGTFSNFLRNRPNLLKLYSR